jgi:hypothetical protein
MSRVLWPTAWPSHAIATHETLQGSDLIGDLPQDDVATDDETKDETLGAVDVHVQDIVRPIAPQCNSDIM